MFNTQKFIDDYESLQIAKIKLVQAEKGFKKDPSEVQKKFLMDSKNEFRKELEKVNLDLFFLEEEINTMVSLSEHFESYTLSKKLPSIEESEIMNAINNIDNIIKEKQWKKN
jgi:hypothetical protein